MKIYTSRAYLCLLLCLIGMTAAAPLAAQSYAAPTKMTYPDFGEEQGMQWVFAKIGGKAFLDFKEPETDNELWRFACEKYRGDSYVIGNTLLASPLNQRADDRFGMTMRVDNGNSFGLIARMDKTMVEGKEQYFPYFAMPKDHSLWDALRRGSRAYIDLGGRRFSIHLRGSGDAIKSFLDGCGA